MKKNLTVRALFVVFLLTYGLEGAYYFLFGSLDLTNTDPKAIIPFLVLGLIVMWIPGITGLLFAKKEGIKLKIFQKPDWMCLYSALIAAGISLVALALSAPFNQWKEVEFKAIWLIGLAFISGLTLKPFVTLGEELFWRGYLHEKWKHLGILRASLIIGAIWGIWHAPLILMGHNYPGYPLVGLLFMCLFCIAGSPLFFWFRERGKSIFIPAIFHASINSFGGFSLYFFQKPNPLLSGTAGVAGIIAFSCASLFLILRERRKYDKIESL